MYKILKIGYLFDSPIYVPKGFKQNIVNAYSNLLRVFIMLTYKM